MVNTTNEEFLREVCLYPWEGLVLANPEQTAAGELRAAFVHVDCKIPFILAAHVLPTAGREENLGLLIVQAPEEINRFLHGPHVPYHRPNLVPWESTGDEKIQDFLLRPKQFRLLQKTLVLERDGLPTLAVLKYGLVLSGADKAIAIYADDRVPMSVRIMPDVTP